MMFENMLEERHFEKHYNKWWRKINISLNCLKRLVAYNSKPFLANFT